MAKNIYANAMTTPTSQRAPLRGREEEMARNNAGGYSFKLDSWKQLERFLILGSENGSYYASERDAVLRNVSVLDRCIADDPARTAEIIAQISESGRAFKNNVALFALAHMAAMGGASRFAAYRVMPRVARTGRGLLEFHQLLETFKVKSNASRRKAYARWMTERKASDLAYQMIKYPTSGTLSMADLVRYAHPITDENSSDIGNVLAYIRGNGTHNLETLPDIVHGWERAKAAQSVQEVIAAIREYRLTWEFVPGRWQGEKEIWDALLPNMPYTALIRNLGRLSAYGLLDHASDNARRVRERLTDVVGLKHARVHPMSMLLAWRSYAAGGAASHTKTKLRWNPTATILDALESGFYLSFDALEPTGKSFLYGIDVSGSMSSQAGSLPIRCCEAAAVLAMVGLRVEQDAIAMAFDHGIRDLKLSKHDSLDSVLRKVENINYGGTDCALPMIYAMRDKIKVDEFVVLTDSETWAGTIHPAVALRDYRETVVPDAKSVVVGMVSNGFSIADPQDPGMLDIVGISPDVPSLISRFAVGL